MKTSRSEGAENIHQDREDLTLENLTSVADLSDSIRVQEDGLCRMKYSLGEEENTLIRHILSEFTYGVFVRGSVTHGLL
jgi:hypothetical protein